MLLSPYLSGEWASYQIRKIAGCACAGNAGNVFPCRRFQGNPLVSDPGMHNGTWVTHVPWYMSGSLTCGDGENVPGIPGACAPAILSIWQEAHDGITHWGLIKIAGIIITNYFSSQILTTTVWATVCTVLSNNYVHGCRFVVFVMILPISFRVASLALWQSHDCHSASKQAWRI